MDPEYWEELQVRRRNQPRHNPKNQVKGLPLICQNEAVLGQSEPRKGDDRIDGVESIPSSPETANASDEINSVISQPLERFSFFERGDRSKESKHAGNIIQLHRNMTTDPGWEIKIKNLQSLTGEAQAQAKVIPNLDQPATNTKKVSTITDPRKRVSSL